MEPLAILLSAVTLGATAALSSTSEQAIKDAYAGLRALLVERFGHKGDTGAALAQLEAKPDSAGRTTTLTEELSAAGAAADRELIDRAAQLLALAEGVAPRAVGGLVGQINAEGGKVLVVGVNPGNIKM